MNPKAIIPLLAVAAVAVGMLLPGPPAAKAEGQSQFALLELSAAH